MANQVFFKLSNIM